MPPDQPTNSTIDKHVKTIIYGLVITACVSVGSTVVGHHVLADDVEENTEAIGSSQQGQTEIKAQLSELQSEFRSMSSKVDSLEQQSTREFDQLQEMVGRLLDRQLEGE